MYPQYWTPSMGVFLCPRSSIASQEISATFKQHICDIQFAVVADESNMRIAIVPEENEKSEPFSNRKQVRIFLVWWARVDSNHRSWKAADLQSVPIGHSGTRPYSFCVHCRTTCLVYHRFLDLSTSFFISFSFIAIFKNSAGQNDIFAICSLRMLLVH